MYNSSWERRNLRETVLKAYIFLKFIYLYMYVNITYFSLKKEKI